MAFSVLLGYILTVIINLFLSTVSYKYFLEYKMPDKITSSMLTSKVFILTVGVLSLIFLLLFIQFVMMMTVPFFSLGEVIYNHFPKFMILFLSFTWTDGVNEGYHFCIELVVYLTILCSLLEYSGIKRERGKINSKSEIIKAVLFPNMITLFVLLSCFLWLYHYVPDVFLLLR